MQETWANLGRRSRVGLIVGAMLIVLLMAFLGWWAYRPNYQVLFADLAPRDAAAMAAELDKSKTPYQLADGGNTIMVPQDLVYKTRLGLMDKDVPLHGAVGFEVFNNADFGMTEFVQKVNYQRAIQGELTRTILSIEGVQSARVHIAAPEQGLFKKSGAKPKASVTVAMKEGLSLAPEQVAGIQRLVAASVPEIVVSDVTVLDQNGVALTRASGGETGGDAGLAQLDAKRGAEEYLYKKVAQVLDRTFGAGEAIATVDVSLNLDQSKVTTEEILPAHGTRESGEAPTGVVVRERHTMRDGETAADATAKTGKAAGSSSSESDYQVGRRTEHLSVAPGGVRRITVAVVVKQSLTEDQRERLRGVVALAVGFNEQRGDAIVVNSMSDVAGAARSAVPAATLENPPAANNIEKTAAVAPKAADMQVVVTVLTAILGLLIIAVLVWLARRRPVGAPRRLLDDAARARMIEDVRRWTQAGTVVDTAQGERK